MKLQEFEKIKSALHQSSNYSQVVYVDYNEDGKVYLGNSGNFLIPLGEAQATLEACQKYLEHMQPDTIKRFNDKLLAERMAERILWQKNYQRQVKKQNETNIYIIHNKRNGFYKIGRAKNLQSRERTLQAEEPELEMIYTMPGTVAMETDLHIRFKEKRIRGEWFKLTVDDIDYIKSL